MSLCGTLRLVGVGVTMAGLAFAGAAWAQAQVQVDHAAARLIVVAEPRSDVSVSIQHGPSRLPPLQVRREGGRIVVDGGLQRPDGTANVNCVGATRVTRGFSLFGHPVEPRSETRGVVVPGVTRVDFADLPVITAHVPLDANVATNGAVWGEVGATRSLTLTTAGCGDWTAGAVSGAFDLSSAGSGDVRAADAGWLYARMRGSNDLMLNRVGEAVLQLGGSGDVSVASISGPLDVAVSGSGAVTAGRIGGPVRARVSGSGDIRLQSGEASTVQVQVSGSGGFAFGGVAGRLQAAVAGSGDVRVAHVTGPVSKSVAGSGGVFVGR